MYGFNESCLPTAGGKKGDKTTIIANQHTCTEEANTYHELYPVLYQAVDSNVYSDCDAHIYEYSIDYQRPIDTLPNPSMDDTHLMDYSPSTVSYINSRHLIVLQKCILILTH